MTIVHPWQKRFVHPLTAVILSGSVGHFVHHFHLLDFSFAWLAAALVVLVGYFFLSRRYDPTLSVIFFVISLVVGYQALQLSNPVEAPQLALEDRIENHLLLLESAKRINSVKNRSILSTKDFLVFSENVKFIDCGVNECQNLENDQRPLWQAVYSKNVNESEVWSLTSAFKVTKQPILNSAVEASELGKALKSP